MIYLMSEEKWRETLDITKRICKEIDRRTKDDPRERELIYKNFSQVDEAKDVSIQGYSDFELNMCGNDKDEFVKYYCERYLFSDYCDGWDI